MEDWKVASNPIGDKKIYQVYRKIDTSKVDYTGNREYKPEFFNSRLEAEDYAERLNMDRRMCPKCHKIVDRWDMAWVNDIYGIAYKCVCYDCLEETQQEISGWRFDEADAGEHLEPEDY